MHDMLVSLMNAVLEKNKPQVEACFRDLERVGCDRMTAKILVKELYKEMNSK